MLKKMRSMSFKHFCLLSFGLLISAALMMGPGATSVQAAKKAATQKAVAGLVDINNASQKELEALPGVGAASAKKIIASRPYKSADDLSKAGLSAKAVDKIKPLVTVGAGSSAASTAVTTAAKADTKTQKAIGGLVDINNASQKDLEALPGVGASSAKKIIAGRPYKSADDLSKAGLSAKVVDKIKPLVTVGAGSSAASTAVTTAAKADAKTQKAIGGLVDINNASQKELEALPGVGAATAKKIVAGRPYKSTDDLSKAGLSAKVIDKIKPLVTVGTASAAASTAATVADSKPVKEAKTASKSAATKLAPGTKISINTADKATLEALPAIGPVKAQAIIDGRPYKSVEDIMKIKGIKQKTFDTVKDYLVL